MINQSFPANSFDISTIPKIIFIFFDSMNGNPEDVLTKTNEIRTYFPSFYLKLFSINSS